MKTKFLSLPKFAVVAAALCASTVAASFAQDVATEGAEAGKWTQDYDAAMALARKEKLPVILNFTGSDWCGWCKLMQRQVFSKGEFAAWAAGRVVLVTIDFPRDQSLVPERFRTRNGTLATMYGIRGYPTYVVLDAAGEVAGRLGASRDASVERFTADFERLVPRADEPKAADQGGV
ncbi:MAG: thioredoxin family protein [Kiritimatiellae bacterium]|nr:thioredoxin family protein [Kiritimatiellia bacterium]